MLDIGVALVCVAFVAAPLLAVASAESTGEDTFIEDGATVDQRVVEAGMISNPLNARFERGTSGRSDGSVSWDVYTTASRGVKLVLSSDRSPAMRDEESGADVGDVAGAPAGWSVGRDQRRFGFTARGATALSSYADGTRWRGLNGRVGVVAAHDTEPQAMTRTTVGMRAQFNRPLQSNARPKAQVYATVVANL